jgi:hypothetical protein
MVQVPRVVVWRVARGGSRRPPTDRQQQTHVLTFAVLDPVLARSPREGLCQVRLFSRDLDITLI